MKIRGIYMEKAKNLSEIRITCLNYPLDREDLAKFYIDTSKARGFDMLNRLELSFKFVPGIYQHVLYLGHTGSGKSTVLYQLEQKLNTTYKVIRFTVQDFLDVNQMELADLLFVMYDRVFSSCSYYFQNNPNCDEDLNDIYNRWFASTEWEEEEIITNDFQSESSISGGISSKIISLFTKLTSVFKFGTTERVTIRKDVVLGINDYIKSFNKLVEHASNYFGQPILLMFEDLEKISPDSADKLFLEQSYYFPRINVHMLLTAPIHLKYSTRFRKVSSQFFAPPIRCPMISITDKEKNRREIGYETLRDIVYARVSDDLIDSEALDLAITYSGGIIRELFKMLCEASALCEIDSRIFISVDDIEKAFISLQETFYDTIHDVHIPIIKYVYDNPQGPIKDAETFIELMCDEIIIEYNCEQWRGVHPAVVAYLKNRNQI